MVKLFINTIPRPVQYLISTLMVAVVAAICYGFSSYMSYQVVAFILLAAVSLVAMFFDILPVLFTAVLTALTWDFLFIPPHFTFHVSSAEDAGLLLMYLVIALINAVLTYKIRQVEKIARNKEEKANTIKLYNTFLNSLSHELKTPIATIIGATDALQNDTEKLTTRNKYELISEVSKAAIRLDQQVENLLNMSRLESGFLQPKKDWCDVIEIVYGTIKKIEEININREIDISINPFIPLFKLDKGMLEQVLYNLVNNAVIYTDTYSKIEVQAHCHTDMLEMIVEDNGSGFPANEIELVFNKFYRLKNSKPGGTGLGLSIVKGFTEAMGGSVSLRNKSTGGAKFIIEIPADTSYIKNLKNE